jgi:transposase
MERAREELEKLKERVAAGDLKQPEELGAAVERIMQKYHDYRDFDWKRDGGVFVYPESASRLGRGKKIEGKYVISTSEEGLSLLEAVAWYKGLMEVESGFRQRKDVRALRPISHQIEPRGKAHIFVAALALLVQRLLGRRLEESGLDLSPERAPQALSTVRLVRFRLAGPGDRRGVTGGCPEARLVLRALKLADQRPPVPPEGAETGR